MMRNPLVVVVLLLVASLGLAQQNADPGAPSMAPANAMTQAAATIQLELQTVAQPRLTTKDEEVAIAEYVRLRHLSQPYAETIVKGWRLFLGLGIWHYPLDMTKSPAYISSEYQRFTEENRQLKVRRYVNMPIQTPPPTPDFALPLGEELQPQYQQPVAWQPKVNGVLPEIKELRPVVQRCPAPVGYAQTAGNGPMGRENNVSVQRIVPDLTPVAWMLLWKAMEHKPTPPKPPTPPDNPPDCGPGNPPVGPGGDDLTNPTNPCDPTPPGGTPGGMTGVPDGYSGSGNIAPGNPSGPGGAPYNPPPPATPGQGGGSPPGPDGPPATPIGGDL